MATIVDGQKVAEKILKDLKRKVAQLKQRGKAVRLGVVLVGHDRSSQLYVARKKLAAEKIGIDFKLFHYPASITTKKLTAELKRIQQGRKLSGLIVQLPLPKQLKAKAIINLVKPELDVDCLTEVNSRCLGQGGEYLLPPTPAAILAILGYYRVSLKNKQVVILGHGELVGKPLVKILQAKKISVTIADRKIKNLASLTKRADVVITAVGRKDLLTGKMLKPGAVVIDAGISFSGKKMFGDISLASVKKVASLVTPTPGGVGPVTVAKLLENTVKAEKNREIKPAFAPLRRGKR